jgi:hypothetical protein
MTIEGGDKNRRCWWTIHRGRSRLSLLAGENAEV